MNVNLEIKVIIIGKVNIWSLRVRSVNAGHWQKGFRTCGQNAGCRSRPAALPILHYMGGSIDEVRKAGHLVRERSWPAQSTELTEAENKLSNDTKIARVRPLATMMERWQHQKQTFDWCGDFLTRKEAIAYSSRYPRGMYLVWGWSGMKFLLSTTR